MSQIIGEAWVKVRPLISGFSSELETEASGAAARAGGRAGREFGAGFRTQSHVGATVRRELGDAERGAAAASFRFTGLGRAAAYASGTFLAAGGLVEGLKRSVGAAAALQGNLALADKAIENAGSSNTAYGQTVEELIRKQALQKGFSEGELIPSFTRLESATHNTRKAYDDLVLAEDVARARHIQVTVAALALSKAEQGSVTSLQRLGIILPASAAGLDRHAKALLANEILLRRFGGSAAAFAGTGAGALARLGEAGHVIEETIGAAALPQVEKIATATAKWASNSENLQKVQRGAATVVRDLGSAVSAGAAAVHEAADAYQALSPAIHGVNTLLGGTRNSVRLLAAAFVVSKLGLLPGIFNAIKISVGRAGASAAVSAGEFNALAAAEARAGAGGAAGAAGAGAGAATKLRTAGGFNTFTLAAEGAGAAAAAKGAFGLGTGAAKIGGAGLILPGLNQDSRASPVDYTKAFPYSFRTPQGQTLLFETKAKRDAYVAKYNAQYSLPDANAATAPRESNPRNLPGLATTTAGRSPRTDLDYALSVQRALGTKTTADELALYQARKRYIDQRVASLRKDTDLTASQKKDLLRLETESNALGQSITAINQGTASDAKKRADAAKAAAAKARQAYADAQSGHEELLQLNAQRAQLTTGSIADDRKAAQALLTFYRRESTDTKLAVSQRRQYQASYIGELGTIQQLDRDAYRSELGLREQKLQLAATRAQLTTKNLGDDRRAARRLIAFYEREAHDAKLTETERLDAQSKAIQTRLGLQGLQKQKQTGASAADIFREAATEFRTYGSNISSRNGVLSGEDERARFAKILLTHQAKQAEARHREQQGELGRQTAYLQRIADALAPVGRRKPPAGAVAKARKTAPIVGG